MRKLTGVCCMILLSVHSLFAQSIQNKLQLNLQTGYEKQDLDWSIAGNSAGENPNIYSELKWKSVGGQYVSAALQWNVWNKVLLTADYSRSYIRSGMVTDNDYSGDNRTMRTYSEIFDAGRGNAQSWFAGAGYALISGNNFSLTPYIGYGISRQSLRLLDQTGNLSDLNSTYETDWKGPFVRANAKLLLAEKFRLIANFTYNQVSYNAKANWNLIQTFQHPVSYRHNAKGFGVDGSAALGYDLTSNITIQAGGGYFTWQTGKGVDELFLSSGTSNKTQLNGVDRKGYKLFGGLVLSY